MLNMKKVQKITSLFIQEGRLYYDSVSEFDELNVDSRNLIAYRIIKLTLRLPSLGLFITLHERSQFLICMKPLPW
jgi:hypothetical protein